MFICYYCEKGIEGVTIVVDEQHLAHVECDKLHKLKEKIGDKEAIINAIRTDGDISKVAKERGIKLVQPI